IQDNPHIESEYESSSENEDSQRKMMTDDGEEKKISDDDGMNSMSVVDEIPTGRSLLEVCMWSFLLL
ncbi:hypothetical protein A2U01_0082550, partial [Trifolium medium]|nr:hypothetical protein [Trifolium medium]